MNTEAIKAAVARAIWNIRREDEDRCDMELEDIGANHSVWREAEAAISLLSTAEQAQPVAKVRVHQTGGNAGITWSAVPLEDASLMRDGDLLYAAPIAPQPTQPVSAGLTEDESITLELMLTSLNDRLNDALAEEGASDVSDLLQKEYSLLKKFRALLSATVSQPSEAEIRRKAMVEAANELIDFYDRTSTRNIQDFAAAIRALAQQEQQAPAVQEEGGNKRDGDVLRWAAKIVQLYDDATMNDDYMIDANDAEGILNALATYVDLHTSHPAPAQTGEKTK